MGIVVNAIILGIMYYFLVKKSNTQDTSML